MARASLSLPIQDTLGNAVTNARVYVYKRGTGSVNGTAYSGTPISTTMHSGRTGSATLSNPLAPNGLGVVEAYTDTEVDVDLVTVVSGRQAILTATTFEYDTPDDTLGRIIRATQAPHNVAA